MSELKYKPYVPPEKDMSEFTLRAIILGIIMAAILGAANAYLGLKAGMTVAATFPAAVISMAILRIFGGTILEENLARTTGAVGEALAAGAIFTIPAFVMTGVWKTFSYWQSTFLMLVGGILGVLLVIVLRRTMVNDASLPYPESVACSEIVKAGQKGATGAAYVFGSMGLAAFLEFIKNPNGLQIIKDKVAGFFSMGASTVRYVTGAGKEFAHKSFQGGVYLESPLASPALVGVGYIIGPRLAAITFSGGVFGWLFLMPLMLFLNWDQLKAMVAGGTTWVEVAKMAYAAQVKPVAVGAMLVGAFYTLFMMRKNLISGIGHAVRDMKKAKEMGGQVNRVEHDFPLNIVFAIIGVIFIGMIFLYNYHTHKLSAALVSALVMLIAGFLFAAVAGYLVGIIGSSSNPISGLTLSTLLIAAILMVVLGMTGNEGVAAVLAVAAVVCCVAGVAGDMLQDWKVGHILGGTPWRMQIGGMIGVIAAALVLVIPIAWLHQGTPGGIGGDALPAPQAGLMAMMAKGIVGGEMAWPLVIAGMLFSIALILIKSPSPMLIAVGMYLPFNATAAIFVGGIIKAYLNWRAKKRDLTKEKAERVENTGTLIASGLVAGEALTGILLAGLVVGNIHLPKIAQNPYLGFAIFVLLAWWLISLPLKSVQKG